MAHSLRVPRGQGAGASLAPTPIWVASPSSASQAQTPTRVVPEMLQVRNWSCR